jgi:imidazolonepropionase
MSDQKLIGPYSQIVTLDHDHSFEVIPDGGVIVEGSKILQIGDYNSLQSTAIKREIAMERIGHPMVLLPGFIDAHTHICFAGSRANDYALRSEGKSYLEIAKSGGGIMNTVKATRKASLTELVDGLLERGNQMIENGITTCEVKSGYGLTTKDELKMLQAIYQANEQLTIDLIPTALPAHICPPEFENPEKYIAHICDELLPEIINQKLAKRADIFIEEGAFPPDLAGTYFRKCQELGLSITAHADQFYTGGSKAAIDFGALSADHLEASGDFEIELLASSQTIGTVLPGASIGLGMPFARARKMLDSGVTLCIASDWNPGSAPMGDLLTQAAIMGIYEKLVAFEIFKAITRNAAKALSLQNVGSLKTGNKADMIGFPCSDYKEILYHQGKLKPTKVWKNGLTN